MIPSVASVALQLHERGGEITGGKSLRAIQKKMQPASPHIISAS